MRIQPRQVLLDLWRSVAAFSWQNDEWQWEGVTGPNSISSAEQLLCILYPAAEVAGFALDSPDNTSEDVLASLRHVGEAVDIPKNVLRAVGVYMDRYTEKNSPIFPGRDRYWPKSPDDVLTEDQAELDVVDSFSMSVTLSLTTILIVRSFRANVKRRALRDELDTLEETASRRLTAALAGLLRSFTVNTFAPDSSNGVQLCRTVNQRGLPNSVILDQLSGALAPIRAGLQEALAGTSAAEALDNLNHLFECGWAWTIIEDTPPVALVDTQIRQQPGIAMARPSLYFTVSALDGIADLFSERTRVNALLSAEQRELVQRLQTLWDLTQRYWSTIATLGTNSWPLENVPWRTTDREEADYFSVLVTSIVLEQLDRRKAPDADLERVANVLEELAQRARVTRRPGPDDHIVASWHDPGMRVFLPGSHRLGPEAVWYVPDFATALLKRSLRCAGLAQTVELRDRLLGLSDQIWDHIRSRRLVTGPGEGLWDEPAQAFPELVRSVENRPPSWYFTERVSECMVVATGVIGQNPLGSSRTRSLAVDQVNELDHLLSQELLDSRLGSGQAMRTDLEQIEAALRRARSLLTTAPATASAVAVGALQKLDTLRVARQDVKRFRI